MALHFPVAPWGVSANALMPVGQRTNGVGEVLRREVDAVVDDHPRDAGNPVGGEQNPGADEESDRCGRFFHRRGRWPRTGKGIYPRPSGSRCTRNAGFAHVCRSVPASGLAHGPTIHHRHRLLLRFCTSRWIMAQPTGPRCVGVGVEDSARQEWDRVAGKSPGGAATGPGRVDAASAPARAGGGKLAGRTICLSLRDVDVLDGLGGHPGRLARSWSPGSSLVR